MRRSQEAEELSFVLFWLDFLVPLLVGPEFQNSVCGLWLFFLIAFTFSGYPNPKEYVRYEDKSKSQICYGGPGFITC